MIMRTFTLYMKLLWRRLSNPVFLILLLVSTCLWYMIKLSYTYTTNINIPVRIDSMRYSVHCTVEGVGYQIMLHKMAPRQNTVVLDPEYMDIVPSAIRPGEYDVSSFSLQNAISKRITTLRIVSVDSPVEITLPSESND